MNIGILLPNIEYNQLTYYVSQYCIRNQDNLIGFFDNPFSIRQNLPFPIMQLTEIYSYNGICFATNILTAQKLLAAPAPKEKYLYLWDLEWLRTPRKIYHDFAKIYRSIKIIARSKDHADYFSSCFNTKVHSIIENFYIDEMIQNGKKI